MDKIVIFILVTFLATSLNCCMAETHTANVGKFNIQVMSDEAVEINDQFAPTTYPGFTACLADIWVANDLFEVIIADHGSSTNVSEDALLNTIHIIYPSENANTKSWNRTDVGGQEGFIASVQYPASIPQFEIVYSPDADTSENRGTMIAAITAYTGDQKMVEDVLKTLKIRRIA